MNKNNQYFRQSLRDFFRKKTNEIRNVASQVITKHSVLRGTHLEMIMQKILIDFIPKRYAVGTGLIYDSMGNHSEQTDLIIWDEQNYPRIEHYGHKLFFAESVKAGLEIKTKYSRKTLQDTIQKSSAINSLFPIIDNLSIEERLFSMEHQLNCIESEIENNGTLIVRPRIATGAIFLVGGKSFDLNYLQKNFSDDIEDGWPEIVLFLEPGIVTVKDIYEARLDLIYASEDALLVFINYLLKILNYRTIDVNGGFYLDKYLFMVLDDMEEESIHYRVSRFLPGQSVV